MSRIEFEGVTYIVEPHVAALLQAVSEERDELKDALRWCSGAGDFQEDGIAREGWLKIAHLLK